MSQNLVLDQQLCFALYSASRETTAAYRPMLDELGITYPQYLVLLVLWQRDGRGVREICDELGLDTGTVSPLLKRLESLGLVRRERLSTDERRVQIRLTEAGAARKALAADIPARLARASGLSVDELGQLRDTLVRYTAHLRSAGATSIEGEQP